MTAVKIVLEPGARRRTIAPWTWKGVLRVPLKRWRGRAAFVTASNYSSEKVAMQGAQHELGRLERETWMGE